MQLYLIRHGQSQNNLLNDLTGSRRGGSPDPELTPAGQEQARRLGEFLALSNPDAPLNTAVDAQNVRGFGLTHLYCSLMLRSAATANITAGVMGLPAIGRDDLFEAGGLFSEDPETGERTSLPGPGRSHFQARFPNLILPDGLDESGWHHRPFETYLERPLRAVRVIEDLRQKHQDSDRVVLVTHGEFIYHLVNVLLGAPSPAHTWFYLNNTSLTRVDFVDGRVSLVYLNRASHLPPELIT